MWCALQELTAKEASGSLGRNERRHPAYKGSETTTVYHISLHYATLHDSHYGSYVNVQLKVLLAFTMRSEHS
jgi:hypothetical protein